MFIHKQCVFQKYNKSILFIGRHKNNALMVEGIKLLAGSLILMNKLVKSQNKANVQV